MLLPPECLKKLECSLCERLLSRFPIHVTEDEDDQLLYVCGRCEVPFDDKKYLRVTIYESVMENAQFPCINREHGCMEYLLPKNVEQHEILCQYQLKKCKICEWEGQSFTVLDHYQSKHADLIMENYKFIINIKEDSHSSSILLHNGEIFSFERNFDQSMKRIKCTLTPLFFTRTVKKLYAQFNLILDDTTVSKRFPGIDLDENEPKSVDINIEKIVNDDSTEATGIINITNNIKEFNIPKQREENVSNSKCNIDTDALCANIAKFDTNLQLSGNRLFKSVYGPCQYGCASDLYQHYKSCLKKTYNCLFAYKENNLLRNCEKVISRKDLLEHIPDKHYSDVATLASNLSFTIEFGTLARKRHCKYLTDNKGNYFILIVQHVDPHLLLWRVEVLRSKEKKISYAFEINMYGDNAVLSLRASCAELTCNRNYNINDTPCIWLHLKQVQQFIDNNKKLSFNISVYNDDGTKILEEVVHRRQYSRGFVN